jgi:hypothetical protein
LLPVFFAGLVLTLRVTDLALRDVTFFDFTRLEGLVFLDEERTFDVLLRFLIAFAFPAEGRRFGDPFFGLGFGRRALGVTRVFRGAVFSCAGSDVLTIATYSTTFSGAGSSQIKGISMVS